MPSICLHIDLLCTPPALQPGLASKKGKCICKALNEQLDLVLAGVLPTMPDDSAQPVQVPAMAPNHALLPPLPVPNKPSVVSGAMDDESAPEGLEGNNEERMEGAAKLASAAQPTGHTLQTTHVGTNVCNSP